MRSALGRHAPLLAVVVVAALGLGVVGVAGAGGPTYQVGLSILGGALLLAAVLRLVLPARRLGLLAARSRPFDVALLLAAAVALVTITWSLPGTG